MSNTNNSFIFKLILSSCFYIWVILVPCSSQELAVVYLQGDVKVYNAKESAKMAKELIYGPLSWDQVLLLKNNSSLKILRQNGETCELNAAGTYEVSKLKFNSKSEQSIFSKFSNYFLSFFGNQVSSENKDSHSNSIFAVSRGDDDVPYLLFPLKNQLSLDEGIIEFKWIHACDTCNFILQIYDFETRALLFQSYMKSTNYMLLSPSKYLKPNKKYFWNIQLDKSNQKSVSNSFTIAPNNDYNETIKNFKINLKKNKIQPNSFTGEFLTIASLFESNKENYAFQYAQHIKSTHSNDSLLIYKIEALCQEELMKRSKE